LRATGWKSHSTTDRSACRGFRDSRPSFQGPFAIGSRSLSQPGPRHPPRQVTGCSRRGIWVCNHQHCFPGSLGPPGSLTQASNKLQSPFKPQTGVQLGSAAPSPPLGPVHHLSGPMDLQPHALENPVHWTGGSGKSPAGTLTQRGNAPCHVSLRERCLPSPGHDSLYPHGARPLRGGSHTAPGTAWGPGGVGTGAPFCGGRNDFLSSRVPLCIHETTFWPSKKPAGKSNYPRHTPRCRRVPGDHRHCVSAVPGPHRPATEGVDSGKVHTPHLPLAAGRATRHRLDGTVTIPNRARGGSAL
jgi:hypothetical protein